MHSVVRMSETVYRAPKRPSHHGFKPPVFLLQLRAAASHYGTALEKM